MSWLKISKPSTDETLHDSRGNHSIREGYYERPIDQGNFISEPELQNLIRAWREKSEVRRELQEKLEAQLKPKAD